MQPKQEGHAVSVRLEEGPVPLEQTVRTDGVVEGLELQQQK